MGNYNDPAYQAEKKRLAPLIYAYGAQCCEDECLMPSRLIPAGTPSSDWHLAHWPDGIRLRGPAHPRCNTSEGAKRGARRRQIVKQLRRSTWIF